MSCPSDLLDSLRWDPLAHDQPSARSKLCSLCRESVQLCDFYKHPNTKDGLQSQCKACVLKSHKLRSEAPSVGCSEFTVTQELGSGLFVDSLEKSKLDAPGIPKRGPSSFVQATTTA